MLSFTVFKLTHKNRGDLYQPICKRCGMPILMLSILPAFLFRGEGM